MKFTSIIFDQANRSNKAKSFLKKYKCRIWYLFYISLIFIEQVWINLKIIGININQQCRNPLITLLIFYWQKFHDLHSLLLWGHRFTSNVGYARSIHRYYIHIALVRKKFYLWCYCPRLVIFCKVCYKKISSDLGSSVTYFQQSQSVTVKNVALVNCIE